MTMQTWKPEMICRGIWPVSKLWYCLLVVFSWCTLHKTAQG